MELKEIRKILKQFHKLLVRGKINIAKALWQQIPKTLNAYTSQTQNPELSKLYPDLIKNLTAYGGEFARQRETISKKFSELPSEDEYRKDPKTWKALLKYEFRRDIANLVLLAKYVEKTLQRFPITPIYTKGYVDKKQKSTYAENEKLILRSEKKILNYLSAGILRNGWAGMIDSGPWTGFWHADLPYPLDNHRIVYAYDPSKRTVTFYTIGTHKELGLE